MGSALGSPLAGTTVIVADDNADSADLLEIVLAHAGASVRKAGSGAEVLELMRTVRADVFLLDISLPDMNGYELLDAIRAVPGFAKTPAVAVSGHAPRDDDRAGEAGFAVHMVKPLDRIALVHAVAELVA